ncbi:DNA helicase UvrD [Shewanella sp. 1180_01]|uniref:DNA helicase UvrD n=1 Tax=Shewanella sp. 1180_01 TaxID=2604451 RepID=UPI004064C58B
MDKRIVLAVAGSGKTQYIIDKLNDDSRALIVTYTINNTENLKRRILKKFGYIPNGIRVYTYFKFLLSFCIRPIVGNEIKIKGITYFPPPKFAIKKSIQHYLDSNHRFYHNRMSKFMIDFDAVSEISERIEYFFDFLCIDEVQDFAANDFNLLCALSKTKVEINLVGDFYQHTFDTSRDGNTQGTLHNNQANYIKKLNEAGYQADTTTLSHSHRCSPTVCKFVTDKIGIKIGSHRTDEVEVNFITDIDHINQLMNDDSIIKLFFKNSSNYVGRTDNWGNTKGLDDFNNICIVLNNETLKKYTGNNLHNLASSTANKLYVACTRAKGNVYFIPEASLANFKR